MSDFEDSIVNQRFNLIYNRLLKEKKIKGKSDIAQKIGTYNHIINTILTGKRNITVDQMLKLFENYNLDANYFFGRSEEPYLKDQSVKKNIVLVPDKAFAGTAVKADSLWNDAEYPRFAIPGMEGELFALEINGDSMLPTLTDGDLVICEPLDRATPFRENQIYIVVTDLVVAKRIQAVKKNGITTHIRLHSDNSVFQPYEVPIEEVQMIMNIKLRLTNYAMH